MSNSELVNQMVFGATDFCESLPMCEAYMTPKWNSIIADCMKKDPNSLPLLILLFYDDFRKYKMELWRNVYVNS